MITFQGRTFLLNLGPSNDSISVLGGNDKRDAMFERLEGFLNNLKASKILEKQSDGLIVIADD